MFILLPAAHDFKLSGPKNLILFYFWHMISKRLTCLKYFDCYVIFCMKKESLHNTLSSSRSLFFSLSHSISLSTFSNLNRTMFPGLFNSEKNICVHFCWKRIRNKWGDFFSCCSVKSTQLYRWENITPFPVYLRVLRRTTVP